MTSRRPMTRTYSGSGRTSSFNEDDGNGNGRSETRNPYLSNVRPENSYSRYSHYRPTRSTLCSVMAQLTEDIQPSFETTLKSKAVSENCNVKFTCVVSGVPPPELKWYKDDMEMDRYCGLPKYEIRKNGKTHTLHIYNCTLDDAAIYQVSASNSKGIVSCSGVLEVGTMNEFQIHQRFFAKLKQKAEKKKKDLEGQKGDRENVRKEKPQTSPERPPRKRLVPPTPVKEPKPVEAPGEPNGISLEVKETAPLASMDSGLEDKRLPPEETLAKKRIKMTNGVDAAVNGNSGSSSSKNHMMGNGGENCYDGGMSLAQFLAETLQSQAAEEKQNSSPVEKPKEMDTITVGASKERERDSEKMRRKKEQEKVLQEEYASEKQREQDLVIERERERERQLVAFHTATLGKHTPGGKHHKGHKDHDHHNLHTSISSMFHSVKDFLFGKGKKEHHSSRHSLNEYEDQDYDHPRASLQPPPPEMPPLFQVQPEHTTKACTPSKEEAVVPMEVDKPEETLESVDTEPQPVSLKPKKLRNQDSVPHTDLPPAQKLQSETVEQSAGQGITVAANATETTEVLVESKSVCATEEASLFGAQVPPEAEEKLSEVVSPIRESPARQEPSCLVVLPPQNMQAASDESPPTRDSSVLPQADEECHLTSTPASMEEYQRPTHNTISFAVSLSSGEAPSETLQKEEISVHNTEKTCEPDTLEGRSPDELYGEEKAEVKSKQLEYSDVNQLEIPESILSTVSQEDRTEPCEPERPICALLPPSAVLAHSAERNDVDEETKCSSGAQEMNVVPESLEIVDLKMQHACTVGEETTEDHNVDAKLSYISGFRSSEEVHESNKVQTGAVETDLERHLSNCEKTEELAQTRSVEVTTECLQLEADKETTCLVKMEELDVSKIPPASLSSETSLDKSSSNASEDSSGSLHNWTSENIPSVEISTINDITDIKPVKPDLNPNDLFIIPKMEIMDPEFKECTLPLMILAPNQQEPTDQKKYDATHMSESAADCRDLSPTQKGMQKDDHLPPTQSATETAHLDKTEKLEREDPHEKGSKQLHQLEYASIPVINVSCSDDKEGDSSMDAQESNAQQVSDSPKVPLFVVPPISVTCHESDPELRLANHIERTETEISAGTQPKTKTEVGNTVTLGPEKSQLRRLDIEEVSEKVTKDNTPSIFHESTIPKGGDNVSSDTKKTEDNSAPEIWKPKPLKDMKLENSIMFEDLQKNRFSVERLTSKPPTYPSLSPASLRKFMSKAAPEADNETGTNVPVITVGDRQNDKADEDLSGGSTPTSSLSCESSPRMKRRDSLTLIRSATPEELASGARRKIFMPKPKDEVELSLVGALDTQIKKESPYMSPSQARRAALLQASAGQKTPPVERRSPLLIRRKATLEVPKVVEDPPTDESTKREEKPAEKKLDPLKAPQVIRKIRGEPFPDASGHLKLWCQFFNVLSDSTIKWYRDEEEILEVKRSGGDETQVALAIVLASNEDCGVFGCTINNEYGTDTTDFLLSIDVLSEILLKEDLEVGEEIEMTPLLFLKGLGDGGSWGDKYFGRIMTETVHMGEGWAHKTSKVKVIYGLDPVFESGSRCIIKVQNPIAYGTKSESNLAERNQHITKRECKVQNMIREYCKIFSAEARVNENFGLSLEVIPRYLMYRPANSVPYATVEAELPGDFLKYAWMDSQGKLITQNVSEVEQKCNTFQHWIHQWTHGNLLVTQLEGVAMKITNIRVVTKSQGYQGLTERGSPEVFDQFLTQHQCNYYCGLLGLRPLKSADTLQSSKIKGSRSPLLNRKVGSNSPQLQRKGQSPQLSRKANSSPKVSRKVQEMEDSKSVPNSKPAETPDALEMR